ncbi:unnamed protein product [Cylindrotheca closterium]|uniref:Uncharacterized protein n=1 Tax=Cylindrotheca closterium TaxID=2856 RepID=A0AAD2FZC9_9STRA|nr:unnamed protein product [Cylindrotheca closterium]
MDYQETGDTKVQFYPSAKLRMYPMPDKEDRVAAWYSREDFVEFRKQRAENIRTIRKLGILNLRAEQQEKMSITTMGIRGDLSSKRRQIRELRRDSRLYCVLKEQYRQYQEGINDPEAIAMSCQHISQESSIEAQEEGQRTHESSLKVYEESTLEQKLCFSGFIIGTNNKRAVVPEHATSFARRNVTRSAIAA